MAVLDYSKHYTPEELDKLVQKYKNGDEAALNVIFGDIYYSLYYTIYLVNSNHYQIEDIIQDTYARIIDHIDQYNMGTNFRAWASRIAHNLAINYYEKIRRVNANVQIDDSSKFTSNYNNGEAYEELEIIYSHLEGDKKKIFESIFFEGNTIKETSELLGLKLQRVYYLYRLMIADVKKIKAEYL